MVAMDMTEKACQRRIIHDISKVINWARVIRERFCAKGAKGGYL